MKELLSQQRVELGRIFSKEDFAKSSSSKNTSNLHMLSQTCALILMYLLQLYFI